MSQTKMTPYQLQTQAKQVEMNKAAAARLLTQLSNTLKANRVSSIQLVQTKTA